MLSQMPFRDMVYISYLASLILQSVEFFRSGFGRYFVVLWNNTIISKLLLLPLLVFGLVRLMISLFGGVCSAISSSLNSMGFTGVRVGGVDVLALANTVLPVDELVALIITWFTVFATCASIRFVRAAWAAIPLKAT